MVTQEKNKLEKMWRMWTNLARHWPRLRWRSSSTLSLRAYYSLEVKTIFSTLTDMLKQVGVERLNFTLTKKKAKALVNTLANSQREKDVQPLSSTLIDVQALPRLRH